MAPLRSACLLLLALVIAATLAPGAAEALEVVDDEVTVAEDSGTSVFDVLLNDPEARQITDVSDPANGTAGIADGIADQVHYTPDANFCNGPGGAATDDFTYTIEEGDTATVAVTVTCVDDDPVAGDDSPLAVAEDSGATSFNVLGNDTDVEGDAIQITGTSTPGNGTASVVQGSPDQVSYTPAANYCGADSFTYTVNGGDTATVSVTVTCSPDSAVANDDSLTVGEDSGSTSFNVLANDSDPDGDAIEITDLSDPAHGSASVLQGSPDRVPYTPDANYCGADSFTYTVNGGDTATVSVAVTCVDEPPVNPPGGGSGGGGGGGATGGAPSAKAGTVKATDTKLTVPLTCTGTASCSISLTLSITETVKKGKAAEKKTVVIGKAKVTLRAGQTRKVTLKLNRAGRRKLTKSRRLKARLKITLGRKTLTTRTVRIKAKRKK